MSRRVVHDMKKIVIAVLCVLLLAWAALFAVNHFCQPATYLPRLAKGMSPSEVAAQIPSRLVAAEIHPLDGSRYSFAQASAKRMGIAPTYLMVLHDTAWPLTSATVCFLYFDDDQRLIDWFRSSS